MKPKRFVILREPEVRVMRAPLDQQLRGPVAGPAADAVLPRTTVEIDEMPPAAARALVRERKATAVAPAMPMKLIAPVARRDLPAAGANAVAPWGLEAVGASTSPFDGSGIVVAVLDTGIDPGHKAFVGLALDRRNFTGGGADDEDGHGTHCAGTIFGRAVGGTRIGVAPGVSRAMIGKVLGPGGGGSDRIAEAILWAVHGGAHVISMSLGIDYPGYVKELIDDDVPPELATSFALEGYRANVMLFERLASFIAARGLMGQATLLVAAAGNESRREQGATFEIAVSPPAVSDGIVSVAALGKSAAGFKVAEFSNTGARISGPGVDIASARLGGGLVAMSGTSMAAPHVAGVAALWAQMLVQSNQFTGGEWLARLIASGDSAGLGAGFDPSDVGAGLVRAPQAG